MGPTGRSAPLRATALILPPAAHPDRRRVDLRFHVHTDGRVFLLDNVTGLLYVASPHILAVADALAEEAGAPPPAVSAALARGTRGGRGSTATPSAAVSPRLLGPPGAVGRGAAVRRGAAEGTV